jgi:hypothetical protein
MALDREVTEGGQPPEDFQKIWQSCFEKQQNAG